MMMKLRQLEQDILAKGKIDGPQMEVLRQQLYADGNIDRPKADFLVELHRRVLPQTPAFEHLFYKALKDHLLAGERIGSDETNWLRHTLFVDGTLKEEERKFLHELKGEAKKTSPEFEALFKQSMKLAHEQHACG
jgi:hypothetical protein